MFPFFQKNKENTKESQQDNYYRVSVRYEQIARLLTKKYQLEMFKAIRTGARLEDLQKDPTIKSLDEARGLITENKLVPADQYLKLQDIVKIVSTSPAFPNVAGMSKSKHLLHIYVKDEESAQDIYDLACSTSENLLPVFGNHLTKGPNVVSRPNFNEPVKISKKEAESFDNFIAAPIIPKDDTKDTDPNQNVTTENPPNLGMNL